MIDRWTVHQSSFTIHIVVNASDLLLHYDIINFPITIE